MQLFYTPDISGTTYELNQQESKHCIRVLRMSEGSILHLTDGVGNLFKAEIVNADVKSCKLRVVETFRDYEKRDFWLHIAIAPTKNIDRFEWFLEKATEIGINEITPLLCEHSERKVIKHDRLERIIISAMKQSLKAYKPILNPLTDFKRFVQHHKGYSSGYIAHCQAGEKNNLKDSYVSGSNALVLIGPEGDFGVEEVGLSVTSGFFPVALGNARLRTETAGIAACHTINLLND